MWVEGEECEVSVLLILLVVSWKSFCVFLGDVARGTVRESQTPGFTMVTGLQVRMWKNKDATDVLIREEVRVPIYRFVIENCVTQRPL